MKEIKVKDAESIRKEFDLTGVVIFGYDENGRQIVATHGKSKADAKHAAQLGNKLKMFLGWPIDRCNAQPLERKCKRCDFFQMATGDFVKMQNVKSVGFCMVGATPLKRSPEDTACFSFRY